MKAKNRPRFDLDALRELAGDKVFARGEAYHRDGQVEILSIEPGRVLAQVAGTEDYRTELTGRGTRIGGECSCPAFEDWGFCKHMVATALAANKAGGDAKEEGVGALSRIRDHLKGKSVEALVEAILGLAERDPALFRKLDMAAASSQADDKTLEARLRKAIDGATRLRDYVEYREVPGWAANVDAALDAVSDLVPAGRAGLALGLAERAIDRIEQALGGIDDSDGHGGALLERARDIHLAAARRERPEPVQLARKLFAREMQGVYDTFYEAAGLYGEALGEKGLAEYRRLAAEAWEKLPPLTGKSRQRQEHAAGYDRLMGILDRFAEREGDVDARVALRTKDLSSPWRYLQLAEFCLAQGRREEALRRAEEGLWMFEDGQPDERLLLLAVSLLTKAGRKQDAQARLQRAFEKAPSLELYARLRRLGGMAAGERAVKLLEARLTDKKHRGWDNSPNLLVRILTQEKKFGAAWETLRRHGASPGVKDDLARAGEATHPREALEVYAERVDHFAEAGGDQAYAEAVKLIARMARLRGAAEQAAYVAKLKLRFARKRNFMKLLG